MVPVGSQACIPTTASQKSFSCLPQIDLLISDITLVNDFHTFAQRLKSCSDFESSSDLRYLLLQGKKTDLGISTCAH